jgi:hypothetical protein
MGENMLALNKWAGLDAETLRAREFLDRWHQPHQELEVGFDRGAGPAGVVGHELVQKTRPGLRPGPKM